MAKSPVDPLRARMLEIVEAMSDHAALLRDYASTPGNAWLARGELQAISQAVSDMEGLLEEIKQADAESGY